MVDQLMIGTKASFDDFDASLKERIIQAPSKKSIRETVPFSNVTYDFSAINGEIYWTERVLEYVFEIIANSPEEMERKKALFSGWVMNVMNENIYDPFEPGWHYVGTFDKIDYEDDECMEKTTITVLFVAYPYKIANEETVYNILVPGRSEVTEIITNDSCHRLTPTFITEVPLNISFGNVAYALHAGETTDDSCKFEIGETALNVLSAQADDYVLTVKFYKEVF